MKTFAALILALVLAGPAAALVQTLGSEAFGSLRAAGYDVGEAECEGERCRIKVGKMTLMSNGQTATLRQGTASKAHYEAACATILSGLGGLTASAAAEEITRGFVEAGDTGKRSRSTFGDITFIALPERGGVHCRFRR